MIKYKDNEIKQKLWNVHERLYELKQVSSIMLKQINHKILDYYKENNTMTDFLKIKDYLITNFSIVCGHNTSHPKAIIKVKNLQIIENQDELTIVDYGNGTMLYLKQYKKLLHKKNYQLIPISINYSTNSILSLVLAKGGWGNQICSITF